MVITWYGHACFGIEENGYKVILDPYGDGSVPGLLNLREKANQVLCSHEHHDHAGVECVSIVPYTKGSCPFELQTLDSYHDEVSGSKRGTNKIHILSTKEFRLAHLGDLGCELTIEQEKELKGLDLCMIPVGGYFTIDALTASNIVKAIKPRAVIPMHYYSKEYHYGYDVLSGVSDFASYMEQSVTVDSSRMVLEEKIQGAKDSTQTTVYILNPWNRN